ncbi:hypothetical protein EVAR_101193_1 [Eumeta japonica]|uniref:Uncharacterized protein n=1 Tax=Eumeta variegata TaxID=151549 RepID=A0A4C1SJL2_EUMVA|nr:hypothetical protein EVAR_101193_1 [Eumeta japonica]
MGRNNGSSITQLKHYLSNHLKQQETLTTNKPFIDTTCVLLATARIKLVVANGHSCIFRPLLDSGSQVNLVTNRVLNKLSLDSSESFLCIEGLGRKIHNVSRRINLELHACSGNYNIRIEAFVIPNIVSPQPAKSFDTSEWNLPKNINLADPCFNQTDKIDLLIGAEFYHQLMRPQQIKINQNLPILQNTTLGWIITGKLQENYNNLVTCAVLTSEEQATSQLIERFWKLEDTNPTDRPLSLAEKRCEDHFAQNIKRKADGRFVVRLPFSENPSILGRSKTIAFNRSKENPADAISRGLAPERLQQHSIWFYGPLFLSGQGSKWTNLPPPVFDVHCSEERKKAKQVLTISTSPPNHENVISRINHRNSFKTLQHTIGYILRFITNSKTSKFCRTTNRALDAHEMEEAMNIIIKIVQAAVFGEELERLSLKTPFTKNRNRTGHCSHSHDHGNISPLILTPKQLRSEIAKSKDTFHGSSSTSRRYGLTGIIQNYEYPGTVAYERVIFIIELPLVNQEQFELFKVIPIPTKINDTTISITTTIEYLATNRHRDEYLAMNTLQFSECTIVKGDIHLCSTRQVRITRDSSIYSCEIALFRNKTSPQCNFVDVENKVSFVALTTANHWLYAKPNLLELTGLRSETIQIHLKRSGILPMKSVCIIKANTLIIHGHDTSTTVLHASHAMFSNITAIDKPSKVKKQLRPNISLDTNLEELTNIQKQLSDLEKSQRKSTYIGSVALFYLD